ncbi:MAG TPA: dihydrolipoyl dehydrogenase [Firmicutes bacterium]|nr:dihydrolipoyl dehydrogenase [Bacillota bacterium]
MISPHASESHTTPQKVAVIGAGPGGYAAAFAAADLGLQVTLIDRQINPGGTCLYRGCIPSKVLLHVARVIEEAERAAACGVRFSRPEIDLDALRTHKNGVITKLTKGLQTLCNQRRLEYIQGKCRFVDSHTLSIQKGRGHTEERTFDYIIIATGSVPSIPPALAVDSPRVMDSTDALALADIPGTLLVIGGGYIGLEIGSIYAALGSRVSVVELTSGLLPGADRDLVTFLSKRLAESLEAVMLNTQVAALRADDDKVTVTFEGAVQEESSYDRVLIAVGRKPYHQGLGLENTKVELDGKGFIKVNGERRTTDPAIFAVGDVTGEPMLAHKASCEGKVAAEVIAGKTATFAPAAIPAVVYTDPEIAWCGLTESQARAGKIDVKTVRFPWAASGRAATAGRSDGVTKLIVDAGSGRILGVGLAGPGAGELIGEGALAIEMQALAADLKMTIHPHPTLSETLMEAAELVYGSSTNLYRPPRRR